MKWLGSIKSWAGEICRYATFKARRLHIFWVHADSILWSICHFKHPARKTVSTQFLQHICIKSTPSLNSQMKAYNQRADLLIAYIKDGRSEKSSEYKPAVSDSLRKLQIAELIETYRITQHITLNYTKDGGVPCIEIRNLNVEGNFSGDFHSFAHVSLINNIFYDDVEIHIIGASYSEDNKICNNKFFGNFCYNIFNTKKIYFKRNKALKEFEISHGLDFEKWKKSFNVLMNFHPKTKITSTNVMLSRNRINICNICDQSTSSKPTYCINNIRLQGGNSFNRLTMKTQHNILTEEKQEIDVEKISFDANDEITPTKNENKSTLFAYITYFTKLHKDSLDKKHTLSTSNYARQVKRINHMLMSRRQDRVILSWGEMMSKSGTSWARAIFCLLVCQIILAGTTYIFFIGYDPETSNTCVMRSASCNPSIEASPETWGALKVFGGLVAWFMNPASLLPSIPITTTSWSIYLLFFLQKLVTVAFYYEIVQVLRRFSHK